MGCQSCSEKAQARRLARLTKASVEVSPQILEARYSICIDCQHHESGKCELLHGQELAEYAKKIGAICPHPERKW